MTFQHDPYPSTSSYESPPPYGTWWDTGAPPPPASPQPRPPRRGAVLLVTAVVAGALSGVGGAAAYDAVAGPETVRTSALDAPATRTDSVAAPQGSVEAVAAQVLPSVVQINVRGAQGAGSGTGFVLSSDGQIITNNHVVEAAAEGGAITVLFTDGTTADASIVGRDPLTDVAVVQAEGASGLPTATLGSSADVKVGQDVVAIGAPFGLESTVTSGIVSALNRPVSSGPADGTASTVFPGIQTDAAINPGNSGGPLVDMSGRVIGINSAIKTASSAMGAPGGSIGLGFAIPMDLARSISDQIVNGEAPTHARIGVSVGDAVDPDGVTTVGAVVGGVPDGSAAEAGGLHPDDVIAHVDGARISGAESLIATVRGYRPGDVVTLTYERDGESHDTEVTLDSDEVQPTS